MSPSSSDADVSIAETATVATPAVAQDVIAVVRAAEIDLLSSDTRHDARRVRSLLHPDFREIGRSGRMWTRSDVLIELLEEPARRTPETDD
ncbi:nuclear transport factor 2 family protein [Microbacterium radiodurans]|uniref:Nuclear transport factor 2 family protein n=1 Tax=Microbacterium radiodurans TaxID=661398 RepID=A0A5J5IUJ1_9MICO|nr:nuclear transport factor 2 family protein [Microbacterium radiodurans]